MKQDIFNNFDMPWVPITALIVFVLCFVAYALWTFQKKNKPAYEKASLIPLEEPTRRSR